MKTQAIYRVFTSIILISFSLTSCSTKNISLDHVNTGTGADKTEIVEPGVTQDAENFRVGDTIKVSMNGLEYNLLEIKEITNNSIKGDLYDVNQISLEENVEYTFDELNRNSEDIYLVGDTTTFYQQGSNTENEFMTLIAALILISILVAVMSTNYDPQPYCFNPFGCN